MMASPLALAISPFCTFISTILRPVYHNHKTTGAKCAHSSQKDRIGWGYLDRPTGHAHDEHALTKTRNSKYLYLAGQYRPAGRVSDALAKALRECGDGYWMAQAKASWRALS